MLVLLTEQLIPKLEKGYGNRVYRISNRTIWIKFRVYNKAGAGEGGRGRGEGEALTETNCGLSKIKGTRTFYISLRNVREVKSVPK